MNIYLNINHIAGNLGNQMKDINFPNDYFICNGNQTV